jgi:hypothetical protein
MPILFAILSNIGVVFAKILGDNVLRWVAAKAALTFLFVVILPIVFNNFLADLLTMLFGMVGDQSNGVASLNPTINLEGLAGWFSTVLKVSECISVITSALVLRATLKMIPFVRL